MSTKEMVALAQQFNKQLKRFKNILFKPPNEVNKNEYNKSNKFVLIGVLVYQDHCGKLLFVMIRSISKNRVGLPTTYEIIQM